MFEKDVLKTERLLRKLKEELMVVSTVKSYQGLVGMDQTCAPTRETTRGLLRREKESLERRLSALNLLLEVIPENLGENTNRDIAVFDIVYAGLRQTRQSECF